VDIGAAKLADTPTVFDVIVMPTLRCVSDVAAQIAGSVGLAGSANTARRWRCSKPFHGSGAAARGKKSGKSIGPLAGAVMMLVHTAKSRSG